VESVRKDLQDDILKVEFLGLIKIKLCNNMIPKSIVKIKQLFLDDFRSAPPPSTPASNGLHRCIWTIHFDGSDCLMPIQSIWCGSTPGIIKEQLLNIIYIYGLGNI